MSQITSHILDTSAGKPAEGMAVTLQQKTSEGWHTLATGLSNKDGRLADLLEDDKMLNAGIYRLIFDTKQYFNQQNIQSFYPRVLVEFEITEASHYHVPLLLNPFGYSTYRGS